jgi:hypothetical protein
VYIWLRRLVDELQSTKPQRRVRLMLQVFVDDSGRGENEANPIFVLAGYAGTVRNWEAAADDLQRIMKAQPVLNYLKGKEAASLSGNFKGWTPEQRDAKLKAMIAVLRKYRILALSFAVTYSEFNRILATPKGLMKTPYALAFCNVVVWMLDSAMKKRSREKIELIFDGGLIGRDRNIKDAYRGMIENLPKSAMDLLVGKPRFEDDREFLPIQMADLFAWHCRRDYAEQFATGKQYESPVWDELRTLNGKSLLMRPMHLIDFKRRWQQKLISGEWTQR